MRLLLRRCELLQTTKHFSTARKQARFRYGESLETAELTLRVVVLYVAAEFAASGGERRLLV